MAKRKKHTKIVRGRVVLAKGYRFAKGGRIVKAKKR